MMMLPATSSRCRGERVGELGNGTSEVEALKNVTAELGQFHRFREAFDPAGLLNPGKAVPTLNRCAEFGRMRVTAGAEPFPELPRF